MIIDYLYHDVSKWSAKEMICVQQWTTKQLMAFATADDMRVAPFYEDGRTPGTPTWIWSVVVGAALYVRAWNGQQSRWYQAAVQQGAGRMHLAGQNFAVAYVPVVCDGQLTAAINQAYERKYAGSPYLPPMVAAGPVSATVQLTPLMK